MPPFELPSQVYISGFKTLISGTTDKHHLIVTSDGPAEEVVSIMAAGMLVTRQTSQNVTLQGTARVTVVGY
jgi:hypothetical protein